MLMPVRGQTSAMVSQKFPCHGAIFFLFFMQVHFADAGLRIIEAGIPTFKQRGEQAELTCNYALGGESLYSVKWYKDDEEFFRYMPREAQPDQFFPLKGVNVIRSRSNASKIVLDDLAFSSSGLYRCEVSVDNLFKTINRQGRMHVVELPRTGPRIYGIKKKYVIGDTLHANCTADRSKPRATLTWYINERKVPPKYTYHLSAVSHPDDLESSAIGLRMRLHEKHFSGGLMRVRCVATVAAEDISSEQDFLQLSVPPEPVVFEKRENLVSVSSSTSNILHGLLSVILVLRSLHNPAFYLSILS